MSRRTDYYDVLGVARDASADEIRRAYRALARKFHPDVNTGDDAEVKFKAINEAYEVLRNSEKRRMYDLHGPDGPASPFGVDYQDFGGFGDVFDAFFGGARPRGRPAAERGADLRASVELEFSESVFGADAEVDYQRLEPCGSCGGAGAAVGTKPVTCRLCKGSGQVQRAQRSVFGQFVNIATCERCGGTGQEIPDPCPTCRTTGLERRALRRSVKIPAGLQAGTELRLPGEGDHGPRGGPPGDLYLTINVKPHPRLERDGDDIVSELIVNVAEAALGVSVEVETVDGPEAVEVPSGMQPGAVVTLRGKGVPHYRGGRRGDHHIRVRVVVPGKLSREQRSLIEHLREVLPPGAEEDPRSLSEKVRAAFR